MEFDDSSKEKLRQIDDLSVQCGMTLDQAIQDAVEEFLSRKVVGESLLAYLDKEMTRCDRETHRSAINFWTNYIRNVEDR
jgi:hypothetical protein